MNSYESLFNDTIVEAWNEFKGSSKNSSVIDAQKVLDVVETARTTSRTKKHVDSVSVYLKRDVNEENLPEAFDEIIERHNLVLIDKRETNTTTLYFTTQEIANVNDIEVLDF